MVYATYTASQAVSRANATTSWTTAMCLAFVRNCVHPAGAPMPLPDANAAWAAATQKETTGTPPPGAIVYFRGGDHGHITISLGGGKIRSTDYRTGYGYSPGPEGTKTPVGTATINDVAVEFFGTASAYRGWSRDYAGLAIRGLEDTSTNFSGTPTLPNFPTPAPAPSEEDELMALTVLHPTTGKQVPVADALWSMWSYILQARTAPQDAADKVWQRTVSRDGQNIPAIQELADAKSAALTAVNAITDVKTALPGISSDPEVKAVEAKVDALAAVLATLVAKVDALPKG